MLFDLRHIPVEKVDFSDKWNLHPWELHSLSEALSSSFSQVGILHPPILLEKNESNFEIVCGFKRLLFACSQPKLATLPCYILEKDTQPATLLDIILTDQGGTTPLSLAEKARFCEIGTLHLQHQVLIDMFFDRLMLDKRASTFTQLAEILKQDSLLLSAIHKGTLQEKVVAELLKLPLRNDRITVVKLFQQLRMGDGKQRKFLPLLRDLAVRENLTITALLGIGAIREIVEHPEMNNPQKILHLSTFLLHRLNPLSVSAEQEFTSSVNALRLPENCTITHSPSFEKDEVTLSVTFKDFSACKKWLPTLKQSLVDGFPAPKETGRESSS